MIFLTYLSTNLRKTIVVAIKCKEKEVGKELNLNLWLSPVILMMHGYFKGRKDFGKRKN